MTIKQIARSTVAALAVVAFAAACSDDTDDAPIDDVGGTIGAAVDDITEGS